VSAPHASSYLALAASGELRQRARLAQRALADCCLCPRQCHANRTGGVLGYCRAGILPRVASCNVHRWEEPPVSGSEGSGTIFFSHCTARCRFCQNYPISQLASGKEVTPERLGGMMLELQRMGCHNINLVTPTHYVPQILTAVAEASAHGLHIPLVYNTSGYDSVKTLRWLDGIVDIYLPDSKYADDKAAAHISGYRGYVAANRDALKEMFRQVGDALELGEHGIARRGMIIRHLVLPQGLSQTRAVLGWIAENLSNQLHISLMSQYYPAWHAVGDADLGRPLNIDEYQEALDALETFGFEQGWQQELDG